MVSIVQSSHIFDYVKHIEMINYYVMLNEKTKVNNKSNYLSLEGKKGLVA